MFQDTLKLGGGHVGRHRWTHYRSREGGFQARMFPVCISSLSPAPLQVRGDPGRRSRGGKVQHEKHAKELPLLANTDIAAFLTLFLECYAFFPLVCTGKGNQGKRRSWHWPDSCTTTISPNGAHCCQAPPGWLLGHGGEEGLCPCPCGILLGDRDESEVAPLVPGPHLFPWWCGRMQACPRPGGEEGKGYFWAPSLYSLLFLLSVPTCPYHLFLSLVFASFLLVFPQVRCSCFCCIGMIF